MSDFIDNSRRFGDPDAIRERPGDRIVIKALKPSLPLMRLALMKPAPENLTHNNGSPIVKDEQPGRNKPCPCGSGKKYKKCCQKKATQ